MWVSTLCTVAARGRLPGPRSTVLSCLPCLPRKVSPQAQGRPTPFLCCPRSCARQGFLPSLRICHDQASCSVMETLPLCHGSVARRSLCVGLRAVLRDTGRLLPEAIRFPDLESGRALTSLVVRQGPASDAPWTPFVSKHCSLLPAAPQSSPPAPPGGSGREQRALSAGAPEKHCLSECLGTELCRASAYAVTKLD